VNVIGRKKRLSHLLFLFVFLSAILFTNFLHIEKTPRDNNLCPACHFQVSSAATSTINFFHVPQLCFLEVLKTLETVRYRRVFSLDVSPRGPPPA
jgi:hypothetical protein